jgi:hypothetical protein
LRSLPSLIHLLVPASMLVFTAPLLADIELPSAPPPQPAAVATQVYVGQSVDIPLSAVSRSGYELKFLIRHRPSFGTLSEIRQTGRTTAVVTYTHDAHAGSGVDQFRYAVQAADTGVSTPAEVTVNVVEPQPIFVAPARVDFPPVAIGDTARQTIEIRNNGGGIVSGHLAVPAPWSIEFGGGEYSLGPGRSQVITLKFAPTEEKQYADTGEFSQGNGVEIGLGGSGFAPIEIVPREVRLDVGSGEVREGQFEVRNATDVDREVRLAAPPEVIVQDSVKVPANSEVEVAMHTRAGFLDKLNATLAITGQGVNLQVPLHISPAPARLVASPAGLDFGSLPAGRYGRVKLTLHNAGGSPADLRVDLPEGMTMNPDPAEMPLQPGESRQFELTYARPSPGKFAAPLVFEGETAFQVPMHALITEGEESANDAAHDAAAAGPQVKYNDIPPVQEIAVTGQTKTELDLAWQKTSPDVAKYVLYLRSVEFDKSGAPFFKYTPLKRVNVRMVRKEARATLYGLYPGQTITLVIVGYDAAGGVSLPSPAFTVAAKPKPVSHIPWTWIGMIAMIGFAGLIVRERIRQRNLESQSMYTP